MVHTSIARVTLMVIGSTLWQPMGLTAASSGQDEIFRLETLVREGHLKRARQGLEQYMKTDPSSPESFWIQSLVRHSWGDLAGAREAAERAVSANDKNPKYRLRLAEVYIDTARQRNLSMFEQVRLAGKFREEIEAVLALEPNSVPALRIFVQFHMTAPMIAGGSKDKARQAAARLAEIHPAEGMLAHAKIAASEKDTPQALVFYRKAVQERPEAYEYRIALAQALADSAPAEAETHARKAAELAPGRIAPYVILAKWLASRRNWTELEKVLAQSSERVPDNLAPYYEAAAVCVEHGAALPQAQGYLRKYLSMEPEPNSATLAMARWRLGQVQEKLGNFAAAVVEYREAVKLNPGSEAKKDLLRLQAN